MGWAHGLLSDEMRKYDFARFRSFTSSTAALRRRSPFPSKGKEQKGKEREFVLSAPMGRRREAPDEVGAWAVVE